MGFSDHELDNLICDIIADCSAVSPPLDRNEIAQHVLDHLGPDLRKHVYAALERMTKSGAVIMLGTPGEPALRYGLPPDSSPRH